ncbi:MULTISPECIES: quaternary amine ABC transporter ATP-binding protein [Brachybacterium]|uniref:Glycine betaine ABC transporter ATP-binding protein n=1 Tax=Brachybacterium alimentarium TaxID=47845 RepID=A0A2A3YMH4_9MICO|nr:MULTISPECIES: glycine betaine/L-proline ABC transporter ATP-binding protein [Brachybacterium]PCC35973.1 glycine betaine ABC transporter ATP-binding protein [Brachybacterium alimentarium]PCC40295.1 glycine betaine ABC transporter ATP-binding protein [Brachybacterium alimentarium]RCS63754.1 glycine betaine/L-proline ABC transporter ATP-binding protein [Brachybacterium sp. JB7]RCS68048.1 glycine betaine/L-proline ABC transporter ATP-binding protein [Brachybacterium alimentarium]RCS79478.1 glyc
MPPVISAEGLYKVFGRRPARGVEALRRGSTRDDLREDGLTAAVIDASFSVDPGEMFVVMGLSGSGKSTLIRMVNGLLPATAGTLDIGGQNLFSMSPAKVREVRRKRISMVFQHFALLPHRTVGENAAYGLEISGLNRSDREQKASTALEMVGLKGWEGYKPSALSGGMQQRVGLARALAAGTDILLMDEAFSALDPLIRRDMQDQLIELQQRLEKTILFITHDLNEAMRIGDRIAMMRDGRIVQIGTSEEILNEPANDYVAKFIQDVDRSRVLTASAIMEQPPEVLGSGQGPRTAHKLLRETQNSWLVVLHRDHTPAGMLLEDDVAEAVQAGRSDLPWSPPHEMHVVRHDTPIADLFAPSAQHRNPLVVVDDDGKFLGVVPRVTLLTAAGVAHEGSPSSPSSPGAPGDTVSATGSSTVTIDQEGSEAR